MKIFKTAKGAFNYVKRNLNTGIEKTINDSIHFGVGESVYSYSKDLQRAGFLWDENSTFTHIKHDNILLDVIELNMFNNNGLAIIQ